MAGSYEFKYDEINDILVIIPHWKIETEADVLLWYNQYMDYMKRFSQKKDAIIVLDDLEIKPQIGIFWGGYRAKLVTNTMRISFRVHSNKRVQFYINTSGIKYNAATEEAGTVEDAIEGILAVRKMRKLG